MTVTVKKSFINLLTFPNLDNITSYTKYKKVNWLLSKVQASMETSPKHLFN